jgi:hypothetical protein
MKKIMFISLIVLLVFPTFLAAQAAEGDADPIQEFISAMTKTGAAKINALNAYIQKFPDTSSKWTRLAIFNLALEYYRIKNYAQVVKQGEKRLRIGNFGKGEEVRLTLAVAESYALKDSPVYNKEKALKYIEKAISMASSANDAEALKTAQKMKRLLSAPEPPPMSPEQRIKVLFSRGDYPGAVSYYNSLSVADKNNPAIHSIYADSLFKLNRRDSAIKEFKALYGKEKKAIYAYRLGTIYSGKDKTLFDISARYFVEASLLYDKEGNNNNRDISFGKAKAELSEKYGYNKLVNEYNKLREEMEQKGNKNEAAIKKLKREIKKLEREIKKQELKTGIEAPPYMQDELAKKKQELKVLESGGVDFTKLEALEKKLNQLDETIRKELNALRLSAKKRLNL